MEEAPRCIVELKTGERFTVNMSASTLKLIRRSNGELPLRHPDSGLLRVVKGKDISSITPQ